MLKMAFIKIDGTRLDSMAFGVQIDSLT